MNIHETTIHARCPYAPVWDYYQITFETSEHLKCEDFQAICDQVRGRELTQEDVFEFAALKLKHRGKLTLVEQHGTNGRLVICESIPSFRLPKDQRCRECGSEELSLPTSSCHDCVCAECGVTQ